jgi:hypothetical protein
MTDLIAKIMVILTLTCIPTSIMYAFITDPTYRNPFSMLVLLFFTYIGVHIWIRRKSKTP